MCHLGKSLAQMSVLYLSIQKAGSLELDLDLGHCNFKWILQTVYNKKNSYIVGIHIYISSVGQCYFWSLYPMCALLNTNSMLMTCGQSSHRTLNPLLVSISTLWCSIENNTEKSLMYCYWSVIRVLFYGFMFIPLQ